jgi:hypothetical protein
MSIRRHAIDRFGYLFGVELMLLEKLQSGFEKLSKPDRVRGKGRRVGRASFDRMTAERFPSG